MSFKGWTIRFLMGGLCKSQNKYRACASGLKKISCRIVMKEKLSSSRNQKVAKGFCVTRNGPKINCVSRDLAQIASPA